MCVCARVNVVVLGEVQKEEVRRMRIVHHPKIVQRAGRRWMVVCDDCARDQGDSMSIEVDVPVESFEMAQLLWEKHYDRRRGAMRGGASSEGPDRRRSGPSGGPDGHLEVRSPATAWVIRQESSRTAVSWGRR
jgi:hypothetical protein